VVLPPTPLQNVLFCTFLSTCAVQKVCVANVDFVSADKNTSSTSSPCDNKNRQQTTNKGNRRTRGIRGHNPKFTRQGAATASNCAVGYPEKSLFQILAIQQYDYLQL